MSEIALAGLLFFFGFFDFFVPFESPEPPALDPESVASPDGDAVVSTGDGR